MTNNLEMWDALAKTDPAYTKQFDRGGFKGTAQNPTYAIKKMTERFGPCGDGWGYKKPDFTMFDAGEQGVVVYATICLWYKSGELICETWGVGGDTVVTKNKHGLKVDDEAFKKATTDALTNAMKSIGVAADIHLGMYDDSKYLNSLKADFGEGKPSKSIFGSAELREQYVSNTKKSYDEAQSLEALKEVAVLGKPKLEEAVKSEDKEDWTIIAAIGDHYKLNVTRLEAAKIVGEVHESDKLERLKEANTASMEAQASINDAPF